MELVTILLTVFVALAVFSKDDEDRPRFLYGIAFAIFFIIVFSISDSLQWAAFSGDIAAIALMLWITRNESRK